MTPEDKTPPISAVTAGVTAPQPQSPEAVYAKLLWDTLSPADTDKSKAVSPDEWSLYRKNDSFAQNPAAVGIAASVNRIFHKQKRGKVTQEITEAECAWVSSQALHPKEFIDKLVADYEKSCAANETMNKEEKAAAIDGFNALIKRIDSNHDGAVSYGEMMSNNDSNINIKYTPSPSPTPDKPPSTVQISK